METDGTAALLLASASPRRRRLLALLRLPYGIAEVDTPEDLTSPLAADPPALARALALEKAQACRAAGLGGDALVLTFDTLVVLDGTVLGKPGGPEDARRMLRSLAGRSHEVVTGCALTCPGELAATTFAVTTRVRMKDLSEAGIAAWMARGEYMGCAGAYNIEGQVASVTDDECHQNVAGLPLCHLRAELRKLPAGRLPGAPASPVDACDAALGRRCALGPRITGS